MRKTLLAYACHDSDTCAEWWRKLPYVCVPVIEYAEEGAQGFVTADLASPGELKAPHVLAFEV